MEDKERRRPLHRRLDNSELIKTGFWVGQMFMILATVLGVYLAAQEGLEQAIRFNEIDDMQNNYFLRRSLYDEVADNVGIIRDYATFVKSENPYDLKRFHPNLQTYVWDTMRYSRHTLQTPSRFLSDIRRFYARVDELITKGEARTYGPSYFVPKLTEAADKMENRTLKQLHANIEALRATLEEHGVEIEEPSTPNNENGKATQ
ncbi:hypothetical protein [Marinobacter oulmenensis]|uniref:Uncharacterized protein n=1 Tax=Marinobacter oulmenensis TaxID=643747 RepID=A0A840ULV1_9GAMM|nr:hypothetical protein [Marinobacter oulmenensis]MBB5321668.1 hypothetical protein [Marinobacter oulmenensis]